MQDLGTKVESIASVKRLFSPKNSADETDSKPRLIAGLSIYRRSPKASLA
ncbi:MAG: hypothetical protein VKK42_01250 [Lyngbya sp.]|nr:hypothetical protein [Lyngbya sp.]